MDNGYLYTVIGKEHREEAVASMKRLRQVDPSAHITIVTTSPIDGFDRCIVKQQSRPELGGIGYKAEHLTNEYYERTFYVDSDVYFVEDCKLLFTRVFAEFDMALMPDPAEIEIDFGLVPYNTGIVLMNRNKAVTETLKLFRDYYFDEHCRNRVLKNHPAQKQITDQPNFMQAIRDTRVKVLPLPSNYNFRYRFAVSINGKAKIIHGPVPEMGWEALVQKINANTEARIWTRP